MLMPNCTDVAVPVGVPRISAIADAMILLAAVWEVELRLVSTATGTKPNTAIKQKAATPSARVNSISENADVICFFTFEKSPRYPLLRKTGQRQRREERKIYKR